MKRNPWNNRHSYTQLSRQIAARVRALRSLKTSRGPDGKPEPLGVNELGRMAGLAKGVVSRIESGGRGRWLSVDVVLKLAVALEVDVGFLITGMTPRRDWKPPLGFEEAYLRELTTF